ncbi:Protein of unknown function [Friedmanniella luteola]|uniref:DUF3866 domain-containing protein n=1 Tax=Friedmanniella luteola TaxID=546871 RepID=A0A1H1QX23_9ACTN|nr:DUF3866 family protein [Friedmanniella luteola]SDS27845.1 Protein of unknown function [Friedmanniella luteola]
MIIWADGRVTVVRGGWPGAVELTVARADGSAVRALAYTALMAAPEVGDRVLLNVAALERGLGTGGYALVIAALTPDGDLRGQPPQPAGHLVKARYLPQQAMVAGADEQGSPHHALLADADDLAGLPVLVADLHSALAPALLAVAHDRPGTRVVYVMSDQGALPLAFSRTVARLREGGLLAGTVTVGQAFGGDLEAVTVHSGLLAARLALGADLVVVSQGPGNLGTGTRWGFSGVGVGEAVNAAATLGGRPVGSLRISTADARPRHRGLSHHSVTAYGRVALLPADLAVPDLAAAGALTGVGGLDDVVAVAAEVDAAVATLSRHRAVRVPLTGLDTALTGSPVPLSTMGRGLDGDPAYFLAAAAAGRHAAALVDTPP